MLTKQFQINRIIDRVVQMGWKIEVKNYRSFTDEFPLKLDLTNGVTALVGPNNSGKTSVLKFLWEFAPLLMKMPGSRIARSAQDDTNAIPAEIRSVSNVMSVFADDNLRPLTIDLSFVPTDEQQDIMSRKVSPVARPISIRATILRNKLGASITLGQQSNFPSGISLSFDKNEQPPNLTYLRNTQMSDLIYFWQVDAVKMFKDLMYFPMLRSSGHAEIHDVYDLSLGSAAIASWKQYKQSRDPNSRKVAHQIETDLAEVFGFRAIDISTDAEDLDYIVRVNNGSSMMMKDLGNGFGQFFLLLLNLSLKSETKLLLFDEPEMGLHPRLQSEYIRIASRRASGPVVFSTHSIGLARSVADEIKSFRLVDGKTEIREFSKAKDTVELLGEMSFSAWRDLGAVGVLFVEGPHEFRIFSEWMRILGLGHKWIILSLGGSTTIDAKGAETIASVCRVYHNVAVVIDSEKPTPDEKLEKKREEFIAACEEVKIKCLVLERRATENYFTDSAIQKIKGPSVSALGYYDKLKGWGKSENFRIAGEMSKQELEATDVGQFLLSLAEVSGQEGE
jgi:ABC-type branched-subunit amino acid transport system ATPase component